MRKTTSCPHLLKRGLLLVLLTLSGSVYAFVKPVRQKRHAVGAPNEALRPLVQLHSSRDDNNNPKKIKSAADLKRARQAAEKRRQGQEASAAMDLPPQPLVRTLGGGTSLMFRMTRRLWDTNNSQESSKAPPWHPKSLGTDPVCATIWRNVRKSKPSLWRYALRTFDRFAADPKQKPTTLHYEGALLACAKLGLWERALEIFNQVEQDANNKRTNKQVQVTDNMMTSLIRASVVAARQKPRLPQNSAALDAVVDILLQAENKHGIFLVAQHLNPIAAAYQSLGLHAQAANLLQNNLSARTIGPEPEDGRDPFNVNNVGAKDKASYALLVKGAVSDGNWSLAVDQLRDMTEAGLYPVGRHLNEWTEISERKTKQRTTRSWKKKREEYLLDSVVMRRTGVSMEQQV